MENIAILTGGDSAEYNIIIERKTVLKHLNRRKYVGIIVHLKNGKYTINDQTLDTSDFSYIKNKKKVKFDKIFIALHGSPAEDGLIQDYFDKLNLPYTSCNAKISSLTFDKFACNKTLHNLGFRCAKSILINNEKDLLKYDISNYIFSCFISQMVMDQAMEYLKLQKKIYQKLLTKLSYMT